MLPSSLTNPLYQSLVKPLFFSQDPEFIHETMASAGELLGSNPITRFLTRAAFKFSDPHLGQTLDGIYFPNPVGLAAGFDYNAHLTGILESVGFGWHTIGTVTWQEYAGNPKPRLVRLPNSKSLIVNKGLKNIGVRAIAQKLNYQRFAIPVGLSIATTNQLYESTTKQLLDIASSFHHFESQPLHHAYYEMNISCPNTYGGEPFTSPQRLELLLRMLDKLHISRPLYLKMPSDLSDEQTLKMLAVANNHNVQGVIMANLWKDKKSAPILPADLATWQQHKGNLSGKPTWERSNHLVALTRKKYPTRFTIIGTGGIFSPEDALHKIELGADLIQLITGMVFGGPQLIGQINQHLATQKTQ